MINRFTVSWTLVFVCMFFCAAAEAQTGELLKDLEFRYIGPSRGGRVTTVTGHRADPGTFYMGATGGGVWKTTDYGVSWENISDGYFETGSIGSIDVADADPNIVYVGTGSDGIRSNVIIGRGMYKSTDAGESWQHIGLREAGQIGSVVVHPTNPQVVYVAALGNPFGPNPQRGVFKSVDGGESWEHVLLVSEKTGAVDIELAPGNPAVVYAALWRAERKPWTIISGDDGSENGVYVSRDAGRTWSRSTEGLPQGLIGKIDFAVSPADPSRVYALVEAVPEEEGLYRSNDNGATWHVVSTEGYLMTRPFYYTNVDADPSDADIVWVNNLALWRSVNGGKEWSRVGTPHGDNHDMWINPDDSRIIVQSNDGGANVTRDGGRTWSTQHNQPTAELYQVDVDERFPYWAYAGQQDNTTVAVPSLPPDSRPGGPTAYWEAIGGCETGPSVPSPVDATIVYSNCKGRFSRYNRATGQEQSYYVGGINMYGVNPRVLPYRFQRVVPIEISPHDATVIYHGSQYVHRTTDEGRTWETISGDLTAFRPERQVVSGGPITRDITGEEHYSTLYVIEVSPVEANVIWTGANDGLVHVSQDGGETWMEVTPPGMPPEGRIQTIDPSPHAAGKAYVAGYRYLLGDFRPYIYRTTDFGATWTLLTDGYNGIPEDFPTRVIREDPAREGLLYAGTEFGLFVSLNDGLTWEGFQQGLPVTPVTDLKVHRGDLVVSTMGRGFWILDNITVLHHMVPEITNSEVHLFPIRDAFRMRYGWGGGIAAPTYPRPGMTIDYYFKEEQVGEVSLEIVNEEGTVVRKIEAEELQSESAAVQGMRGPVLQRPSGAVLVRGPGMHRYTWNLRHNGFEMPSGGSLPGPVLPPGMYTLRLNIDGDTFSQEARLLMDPRVAADNVSVSDLEAQFDFGLDLTQVRVDAAEAVQRIESLMESSDSQAHTETLKGLHALLVTETGDSYPQPMLINQLGYLSSFVSRGDYRPGQDAYDRLAQLREELSAIVKKLDAF